MYTTLYAFLLPTIVFSASIDVTFKNVEFRGFSIYSLKFKKTIKSADTLKGQIPDFIYDHLEFTDQNIPVLKEGSITDIDVDELTIESSKLKEIQPGAFKNVPYLRRLSLKDNELEEITEGVFNNLQLSMLDLSKNRIKHIEASALNNLPNLLNINLADNRIDIWDKRWFYKVPLLTRISMQNNSLEKIPAEAFTNLNGNKKFGSVKLTINFIFSHNKISQIENDAFKGLNNINNLWLDNNRLTDFADNLLEKVDVQDLRIEHNQISCLKGDLSKILKAETTHMDGNPFDCSCVERIKKWAKDHDKNVDLFYADMDCMADRIRKKLDEVERRIKEIKDPKEVEETSKPGAASDNDVEILFK